MLHLLLSGLALGGCHGQEAGTVTASPIPSATVTAPSPTVSVATSVPTTGNEFAWATTRKVLGQDSAVFSPFSLREALGLLHLGARGKTSFALAKLCGFPPHTESFLREHEAQSTSLRALQPALVWRSQNALFVSQDMLLLPEYQKTAERTFRARAESVDFADVHTVALINQWVAKQTEDKIKKLLPRLPANTRAVLLNAVYLKATWEEPFEKDRTRPGSFFDGTRKIQVPMMNRTGAYALYAGTGWRMLEVPYRGGRVVLDIVLPNEADGLQGVLQTLDEERFNAALAALKPADSVALSLPRFKIESDFQLLDLLTQMGLPPSGDFSGMSHESVQITDVLQKAFVEVDETGTQAAAATAVVIGKGAPPSDEVRFQVDRPFLFVIRDRETGALLFTGQVYKP